MRAVAEAARSSRASRREIMTANGWSLRGLCRNLETPCANPFPAAHAALDSAICAAYGMADTEEPLAFLLRLNLELAEKEARGQPITPPARRTSTLPLRNL